VTNGNNMNYDNYSNYSEYDNYKDDEYLMDAIDNDNLSECCDAPIRGYAFCSACMENV